MGTGSVICEVYLLFLKPLNPAKIKPVKYIQIDDSLGVPKYRQIINSIYTAISVGELKL